MPFLVERRLGWQCSVLVSRPAPLPPLYDSGWRSG